MHITIVTPHLLKSGLIASAITRQNLKHMTISPQSLINGFNPETDALLFPHAFEIPIWYQMRTLLENLSPKLPLIFIGTIHKPVFGLPEFKRRARQCIFLDDSIPIDEIPLLIRDIIQKSPLYDQGRRIAVGSYTLDRGQRVLENASTQIAFTKKEFFLLELLMQNINRIISRDSIVDYVWDRNSYVDPNTIDVYMSRLRHKLADG